MSKIEQQRIVVQTVTAEFHEARSRYYQHIGYGEFNSAVKKDLIIAILWEQARFNWREAIRQFDELRFGVAK